MWKDTDSLWIFMSNKTLMTLMSHLKSKDVPTQMTKQSFTIIYFITFRKLYTLKSFAEMFTIEDNIFHSLGYSSSNPKLKTKIKSQLVTFTSVKLN